jgi:pimeloyl-ACP methyl ester carboxylesterase
MRTCHPVLHAIAVALLVAAVGTAHVLADNDPAPPREFGPDTYATGVFTGQGTTTPGLVCDSPPDPSTALTCSGFLASGVDRTLLDVTVRVPRPDGLHPLVVFIHGWGASKNAGHKYDDILTQAGYTYLRYSTRGFGNSWGQANLADVNVEIADLRNLVGQVVDDPRLQADPNAVAVMGASYGGAHSWLAAVQPVFQSPGGRPVAIRTVAPIAAWSDLLYALVPNGRPNDATTPPGSVKLSYLDALYLTGIRLSPARPYLNYPFYLTRWAAEANATEPNYQIPTWRQLADGVQGYRSVYWQTAFWEHVEASMRLPIFQIQGFTDDLFPIDESLRMWRGIKALDPDYPIALYFGDIGHPRAANKPGEVSYILDLILRWFAYYLKGVGAPPALGLSAAITRPRDIPFSSLDVISVGSYDELAIDVVSWPFPGTNLLTFNPTNTSGFVWDPIVIEVAQELGVTLPPPPPDEVPGDVAVYTVPIAQLTDNNPDGLLIAGQPTVALQASTRASRIQLNVRLFDVKSDGTIMYLVTRGTYTIDTEDPATPIGTVNVTIPTYGNLWHADADDTLRLEITNVDTPYIAPSRIPSVTEISMVQLQVPRRD